MFEVGEVSAAHHKDFIVMVVDGASSHVSTYFPQLKLQKVQKSQA
jgi:hypothetical protein